MANILIFGGTTEGRQAAQAALARGDRVTVSVASDYARTLLPEGAACHVGALEERAMLAFIRDLAPDSILDATHPFAAAATRNIRACAAALGLPYCRISRAVGREVWRDAVIWADTPEAAAALLPGLPGNVLLTTGSHTLGVYAARCEAKRLYARVLPTLEAIACCRQAGIPPSHVIAMQGPFSRALNGALYDQLEIAVMVAKDSGELGGVTDKVLPALERGIHVIMLARPKEDAYAR